MKFTAQQIATLVQGKVEGDEQASVSNLAKIEEAKAGDFCFLANPKYEDYLYETKASVVMINNHLSLKKPVECTLIRVPDAYASFALLLRTYQDMIATKPEAGIQQPSFVAESAKIGEGVFIGAFTYIEQNSSIGDQTQVHPNCFIGKGVKIGKNCILNPGVKIYQGCVIGDHVILHAGTVIGSDGFGFAMQNGQFEKIPQLGNVVIENHVEIGANCTIDRATLGSTIIRKGAKLDNLIQIAHNVEVGSHTVIAAQAGVSGSTKIGAYCMVGGQAGIVGHIKIADQTRINAQSGVSKEVKEKGASLTGSPAFDYRSSLKSQAVYRNLPELQQEIRELKQTLEDLKKATANYASH